MTARQGRLGSVIERPCAASVIVMLTRGLRVVAVVLLVALSGGAVAADATDARPAAARKARFEWHGIDRSDVRGADPSYTRKTLADFRNHKRMCGGTCLPNPCRYFVPQGLALT